MNKPKILLLDNDKEALEVFGLFFQKRGFTIDFAETGEKALALAKQNHYDVALIDEHLGQNNERGHKVAMKIQKIQEALSIIIMTKYVDALQEECDSPDWICLSKPKTDGELEQMIETIEALPKLKAFKAAGIHVDKIIGDAKIGVYISDCTHKVIYNNKYMDELMASASSCLPCFKRISDAGKSFKSNFCWVCPGQGCFRHNRPKLANRLMRMKMEDERYEDKLIKNIAFPLSHEDKVVAIMNLLVPIDDPFLTQKFIADNEVKKELDSQFQSLQDLGIRRSALFLKARGGRFQLFEYRTEFAELDKYPNSYLFTDIPETPRLLEGIFPFAIRRDEKRGPYKGKWMEYPVIHNDMLLGILILDNLAGFVLDRKRDEERFVEIFEKEKEGVSKIVRRISEILFLSQRFKDIQLDSKAYQISHAFSKQMEETLDLEKRIQLIVDKSCEISEAETGFFRLFKGYYYFKMASRGCWGEAAQSRIKADEECAAVRAKKENTWYVVEKAENSRYLQALIQTQESTELKEELKKIKEYMVVNIGDERRGNYVGAIVLGTFDCFDREKIEVLKKFVEICAPAIYSSWLNEESRIFGEKLTLLNEIANLMESKESLEEKLFLFLKGCTISGSLEFNRAIYFQFSEEKNCLTGLAGIGPEDVDKIYGGSLEKTTINTIKEELEKFSKDDTFYKKHPFMKKVKNLEINPGESKVLRQAKNSGAMISNSDNDETEDAFFGYLQSKLGDTISDGHLSPFALMPVHVKNRFHGLVYVDNPYSRVNVTTKTSYLFQLFFDHFRAELEVINAHEEKVKSTSEFVEGACHSLNNNLASIGAILETLDKKVGRNAVDTLDYLKEKLPLFTGQLNQARRNLTDLKPLSTIIVLKESYFHLLETIRNCAESLFVNENQQFQITGSEILYFGDEQQISRAVQEIFMNMTHLNIPKLEVRIDIVEKATSTIGIALSDNGPGVPYDKKEKIFKWFFKDKSIQKSGVESSGLGLPIARKIIELHEGQIKENGIPGEGARFEITLLKGRSK
ncbi:MAG: hybrid sensor histidine kinase/response regulator [Nitrospinae bacterium]|nr:hybrid sensor histidine kinase/response regulator [Nitrospinota bacterium]